MSTTFIVICVFASVGALCVIIYYAHTVDQLTTENKILQRRNKNLEERFAQEEEQAASVPAQPKTGVEILQTFAQSHQIKLESGKDYSAGKIKCVSKFVKRKQGATASCFHILLTCLREITLSRVLKSSVQESPHEYLPESV